MDETNQETDDKEASKNRVKKKRVRSSHSKRSLASGNARSSKDSEAINQKARHQTPEGASRPTENGLSTAGCGEADPVANTIDEQLLGLHIGNDVVGCRSPDSEPHGAVGNGFRHQTTEDASRPTENGLSTARHGEADGNSFRHHKELAIESVDELNHLLCLYAGKLGENLFHYGVTVLKLVDCNLTALPHDLGLLVSLEVINVSQNKLEELPNSIGQLRHLYSLQAEYNSLTSLPKSIKDLKSLSVLVVNDNLLKTLPNGISDLPQLDTLDVSSNVLRTLPVVFESAQTISRIYAQKNLIKSLPSWLAQTRNLQELHLGENHISAWSDFKTFGKVAVRLQMLDLCENKLCTLADSFDGLSELSCLNLGRNPFENQRKPWASGNFLTSLPKSFCQLKKVTLLSLDGNQLKSLPNNFGDLVNLRMINLVQNCLETLPDSFCKLQSLELCLLSRNCLKRLPQKFGNLPFLNHLEVSDNRLCELPTTFKNLVKLTYLDLSSNRLMKEPNCLHLLTNLNYLNLHSNPFEHSAGDIVDPELSYAYVADSSDPPKRGQFEDLETDDEARESHQPHQDSCVSAEPVTLTSPSVEMDHPTDSLPKVEQKNGTKGEQISESEWRQEEEEDVDEEEEEGADFDWELSNGLCDVDTHNSEERHMFMPSDLHCKNVRYNSGSFRCFPGQFDDADG